ncbi:hypothetical protein D3C75_1183160 [compost metagenome]
MYCDAHSVKPCHGWGGAVPQPVPQTEGRNELSFFSKQDKGSSGFLAELLFYGTSGGYVNILFLQKGFGAGPNRLAVYPRSHPFSRHCPEFLRIRKCGIDFFGRFLHNGFA